MNSIIKLLRLKLKYIDCYIKLIYIYICMCVCVYTYIYIYTYIHIYIHEGESNANHKSVYYYKCKHLRFPFDSPPYIPFADI